MLLPKIFIRDILDFAMEQKKILDRIIDTIFDVIFSKDKTRLFLILIIFIAFVLRLIAAFNLGVFADDMHFAVHAINFLHSGKLVVYDQSASLWYYLTDIAYTFFGTTQIGSRMVAVLFGAFSTVTIFLFTREFFDKKTALISALLLALSSFHIKNTIAEMDVLAMFFVMSSMLYFTRALKKERPIFLFGFAGILFGISILTKAYVLLFIPVFIGQAIYMARVNKKKIGSSSFIRPLFVFLIVAGLFAIPALAHNYLLFKDKGFVDFLFTNTLGIAREQGAQYYSWDAGWGHVADWKGLVLGHSPHIGGSPWPSILYMLGYILRGDPLIFFAGIVGFILCFRKNRPFLMFSLFTFVFVFLYLAARISLMKHYIFLLYLFIPAAAAALSSVDSYLKEKIGKYRLRHLSGIIIIYSLIFLGLGTLGATHFYAPSSVQQVMSLMNDVPSTSLIVADARIYRGEIHWMFNGKTYLESSYLSNFLELSRQEGATPQQIPVYFVECVTDDCGWGTIAQQPEFNESMEEIVSFFSNRSQIVGEARVPRSDRPYVPFIISNDKFARLRVYKTTLAIDPRTLAATKSLKTWFLYPIGYDESISPIFDKYTVHSPTDNLINLLAHAVLYLAIVFSLLAPLILLIESLKK